MRPFVMLVLVSAVAAPALGQLSVTTQDRRVFAKGSAATMLGGPVVLVDESEFVAPGFGPFNEAAEAQAQSTWASGKGLASQSSSLGGTGINAVGVTEAWSNFGPSGTPGLGEAEFECRVGFDVAAPLPVRLSASLALTGAATQGSTWTIAALERQTPAGPVFVVYRETTPGHTSASYNGTLLLAPGSYTLLLTSDCKPSCLGGGAACSGHYRNDMSVSLTVCYPDCTIDGALTVADFGCFQTKFASADPYGDCNADGVLTVADFGCFQTRFVQGCP